jgi:formate/nitrite transporter
MAWASRKVKTRALALNWLVVFAGNFVGAFLTAVLMFYTTQYEFGGGAVGLAALSTADAKLHHGFVATVMLGIMCNALVCLAIWMSYSGRSTMDKIISVIPPVAAFVAAGFEHCIANIYYVPVAILIKAGAPKSFWDSIQKAPGDYADLTWLDFLSANLIPTTMGNVIGGGLMVGAVYWFVYLRAKAVLFYNPAISFGRCSAAYLNPTPQCLLLWEVTFKKIAIFLRLRRASEQSLRHRAAPFGQRSHPEEYSAHPFG